MESHLLQMRGLKQRRAALIRAAGGSHLLQMRGLKHFLSNAPNSYIVSHLLQMRGLKRLIPSLIILAISRIFYRCVD